MNKFEINLLNVAFQNYRMTGNAIGTFQARNGDDWLYISGSISSLEREGFITFEDDFDPDETNLFEIIRPVRYKLTNRGLAYCLENLNN